MDIWFVSEIRDFHIGWPGIRQFINQGYEPIWDLVIISGKPSKTILSVDISFISSNFRTMSLLGRSPNTCMHSVMHKPKKKNNMKKHIKRELAKLVEEEVKG